jgi:hypothetical protein
MMDGASGVAKFTIKAGDIMLRKLGVISGPGATQE